MKGAEKNPKPGTVRYDVLHFTSSHQPPPPHLLKPVEERQAVLIILQARCRGDESLQLRACIHLPQEGTLVHAPCKFGPGAGVEGACNASRPLQGMPACMRDPMPRRTDESHEQAPVHTGDHLRQHAMKAVRDPNPARPGIDGGRLVGEVEGQDLGLDLRRRIQQGLRQMRLLDAACFAWAGMLPSELSGPGSPANSHSHSHCSSSEGMGPQPRPTSSTSPWSSFWTVATLGTRATDACRR